MTNYVLFRNILCWIKNNVQRYDVFKTLLYTTYCKVSHGSRVLSWISDYRLVLFMGSNPPGGSFFIVCWNTIMLNYRIYLNLSLLISLMCTLFLFLLLVNYDTQYTIECLVADITVLKNMRNTISNKNIYQFTLHCPF